MDREEQREEPGDVSLRDILKAVKEQRDINSKLRQELSDLKNDFYGSALSVTSQVKNLKQDQEYKWKYESNKIQFSLNSEILEDLNQVVWAIDNSKIDHARETVNEIVDKQYEANPVASNSEDENKINKAENRALRKRKFKSTKKDTKKTATNTTGPSHFLPNFTANSQQKPFRDSLNWFTGVPLYSGMPSTSSGNSRRFQQGACYGCGSMQHWRNPKADTKSNAE
ncbi:unnamed protein product [Mytilus coruscus]|uniref:Uncharacterized protein n=1 Tax=Mytilus coruscus TaxID=42192 RepID=A0A6J8EWD2_MYTCO|nr:unnamed protein product [Mytilus coruscus]